MTWLPYAGWILFWGAIVLSFIYFLMIVTVRAANGIPEYSTGVRFIAGILAILALVFLVANTFSYNAWVDDCYGAWVKENEPKCIEGYYPW